MKWKVVACGVFEPYLERLSVECEHEIVLRPLDAGLHARPHDLRVLAQNEIDEAAREGGYDAVLLFYGLCGRGTAGLVARDVPIVMPRAHDCITLFLGSHEAYLRQFARNPGTFYSTLGWIEKKTHPRNREAAHLYRDFSRSDYHEHPEFGDLRTAYGEQNAEEILRFLDRWKRHYTRAAYIHLGFLDEQPYVAISRSMAEANHWKHEVIEGNADLLRAMLSGDWPADSVLVVPPGYVTVSTGDDRVLDAVAVDAGSDGAAPIGGEETLKEGAPARAACGIGLGIDAGGTYTDAVIYDLSARKLLAKAKSLTTYHDFLIGIRGALVQLPLELLAQVQLTSLSTTLATNALVEGRGHKVGLIVLSPWDWFAQEIGHQPCEHVPGAVDITGEVLEPLNEDACRRAIDRLIDQDRCAAIVVAGYATIRNPEQANRVRELVLEKARIPVICSHEVSRRMNAVRGAQTALANARLLPVIHDLIDAVHQALSDFRVDGRLMVVKGDGTPVDEAVARARPIETILSGPAASVSGARILTGLDDAVVVDIGGTTTDCAVLEHGRVAVSDDGARIGRQVMSVDVVEMLTVGLGGDSRIDFNRDRMLTIGPARNIPLCCIAAEHSSIAEYLRDLDERAFAGSLDASPMDVLVLGAPPGIDLTEQERALVNLLADGPMPAARASDRLGVPAQRLLPLARLEACGTVKRSALTPTDLLHVTGRFVRWDVDSARRALAVFAAMVGRPEADVVQEVRTKITRRLFEEVVRREVSREEPRLRDLPDTWRYLLDCAFSRDGSGLRVRMALSRPIVAIGAPASVLAPPLGDLLESDVVVPEDADVANAVGAIATEIVVREQVTIVPGTVSNYLLYGTGERMEFAELDRATRRAAEIAERRALNRAREAGAVAPEVTVTRSDRVGTSSDGGRIFLERCVSAVATGSAFGTVDVVSTAPNEVRT